jgi:hypothetical protein
MNRKNFITSGASLVAASLLPAARVPAFNDDEEESGIIPPYLKAEQTSKEPMICNN